MFTVRHILEEKGKYVWAIESHQTVLEALELMKEKDIGAVLVMEDEDLIGIFSERDLARYCIGHEQVNLSISVSDLMSTVVIYVTQDTSIDECMALMSQERIRHLPVLEHGMPLAMISMRDVVEEMISQKNITIHSLENYILGQDYVV